MVKKKAKVKGIKDGRGLAIKHGHSSGGRSPTYISWEGMKSRCYREGNSAVRRYNAKS